MFTDLFMIMTIIESNECIDVAISGANGAFLLFDKEDFGTVKFMNEQVDAMCKIDENIEEMCNM